VIRDEDLEKLLAPFGVEPAVCNFLSCSQNYVYSCSGGSMASLIRISTDRHRTLPEVDGEMKWLNFLASGNLRVCRPIPSLAGNLTEQLRIDGRHFIVCRFEKAPGDKPKRKDLTPQTYFALGQMLGRMHAASCEYHRFHAPLHRMTWDRSRLLNEDVDACKPPLTRDFYESLHQLMADIQVMPQHPQGYGMIHSDVSFGNCHLDGKDLWLFDFDNCEYGHFLQDLATVLYDSVYCKVVNEVERKNLNHAMKSRWLEFLNGYRSVRDLPCFDLHQLENFFLLREAVIYIHYHRVLDLQAISPSFHEGMNQMRRNVEGRTHEVDFSQMV
jgi:Ser/Thr protein kinase RdoA (MazF antagonist)